MLHSLYFFFFLTFFKSVCLFKHMVFCIIVIHLICQTFMRQNLSSIYFLNHLFQRLDIHFSVIRQNQRFMD